MKRIYLDYSATTPLLPEVKNKIADIETELFGNPSSVHWFGRKAKATLEETREEIAHILDARSDEIIFTSGGTEANALALVGTYLEEKKRNKTHIVVSAIEHHSVLHTTEFLKTIGADVTIVPVQENGIVDPNALADAICDKTCLVSVMMVNNEIGTIQPLQAITEIVHQKGIVLHTDAVQAIGKFPVSFKKATVDLLSLSAHKFYGPKGIGILIARKGIPLTPLLYGGMQENNRRAGTENLAAVVGCSKALQLTVNEMTTEGKRIKELKDFFVTELLQRFDHILINGDAERSIPQILNISFDSQYYSLDSDALVAGLDLRGIAVSSGAACSSGSITPSHVIRALGRDETTARASLRLSFGKWTTKEDLLITLEALEEVIKLSNSFR